MEFCKSCGAELKTGTRFCTKCGTPVAVRSDDLSEKKEKGSIAHSYNKALDTLGELARERNKKKNKNNFVSSSFSDEQPVYKISGVRGRAIAVFEDKVIISVKANISSFLTKNLSDGEKIIYYTDVIGVQYRPAKTLIGYIQLETASAIMNNRHDNFFNENTFTFNQTTASNDEMQEIANYIKQKVEEAKKGKNAPVIQQQVVSSAADEIKKYKELLDMGVISQDEFEAKKKELLNI